MVLPGHLAGGYLTAAALMEAFHPALSDAQTAAVYIIGTIAGELPDMDLVFFYISQVSRRPSAKQSHRDHVTHIPAFWLAICVAIVATGLIIGSVFVQFIGWAVLAGTWSHFILDSIEYGIRWLYPFSSKRLCLREVADPPISAPKGTFRYYWVFLIRHYMKRVSFYAEAIVTVAALWVFCTSFL